MPGSRSRGGLRVLLEERGQNQMRKLGILLVLPIVGALLGITPAIAQPAPSVTSFCDAALNAERPKTA